MNYAGAHDHDLAACGQERKEMLVRVKRGLTSAKRSNEPKAIKVGGT
jgi:hypothetical protein